MRRLAFILASANGLAYAVLDGLCSDLVCGDPIALRSIPVDLATGAVVK